MAGATAVWSEYFLAGIAPEPVLNLDEWADEYRILSAKASGEPGPYRTARTPFLREIARCLSPSSPVQKIVFMKSAQIGASELGINWIGYTIHHSPGPMLVVQPTVELAKRASRQRIQPMIEDCEVLRDRVMPSKSRDSSNTMLSKDFAGGVLILTGANSGSGLRSMPVAKLFLDEVDAYPADVSDEGSPVEIAEARTTTFSRRKVFMPSTPTIKGASAIEAAYEESDMRRYHVPCPLCGDFQHLKWRNLVWDKDDSGHAVPTSARYRCEHCNGEIQERYKTWMLAQGKWIADNPGAGDGLVAGFHINALYSPIGWFSWADMVREWYKAQKNIRKLKAFINTRLGETYEIKGEDTPDWKEIYNRRETYSAGQVPPRVALLTASVDVQKGRLEANVIGWNRSESWVIDHVVIIGDETDLDGPWRQVEELLEKEWPVGNATQKIKIMAVDTGYNTAKVYEWIRTQDARRVFGIKGKDDLALPFGTPKYVDITIRGKKILRGVRLWMVGTNLLKADVYGRIKKARPTDDYVNKFGYPPGYVHFPQLSEEYFRQLTAEQFVMQQAGKNGRGRYEWVKTYPRNEALDLMVYATAAYHLAGAARWSDERWRKIEADFGIDAKPEPPVILAEPARDPPKPAPVASQKIARKQPAAKVPTIHVSVKPRSNPFLGRRKSFW